MATAGTRYHIKYIKVRSSLLLLVRQ